MAINAEVSQQIGDVATRLSKAISTYLQEPLDIVVGVISNEITPENNTTINEVLQPSFINVERTVNESIAEIFNPLNNELSKYSDKLDAFTKAITAIDRLEVVNTSVAQNKIEPVTFS